MDKETIVLIIRFILLILGMALVAFGLYTLWQVDWKIAVGVFFFAWGNNMTQSKK